MFVESLRRDQILHLKTRLRHSLVFKEFKVNREEHKDLRVRSALLRHAALTAREAGCYVYQRQDSITIDRVSCSLDQTDSIPMEYRCRTVDL